MIQAPIIKTTGPVVVFPFALRGFKQFIDKSVTHYCVPTHLNSGFHLLKIPGKIAIFTLRFQGFLSKRSKFGPMGVGSYFSRW